MPRLAQLRPANLSAVVRFLWAATRGHRWRPWASPYLRWRIETFSGRAAGQIGFGEFWRFVWRERHSLGRFLLWAGEMGAWQRRRSGL